MKPLVPLLALALCLTALSAGAQQELAKAKKAAEAMGEAKGVQVDENGKPIRPESTAEDAACPLKDMKPAQRDQILKYVVFQTLAERAGFTAEADWRPVLYIVGENAAQKKLLADYGLEKGLAFSYDPQVEINNTDDHVVMLSTRLFDDRITCTFDEAGFVIGHELAHHKLKHMSKLAELKKQKFPAWWKTHQDQYRGACPQDEEKAREVCFRQKVWPKYLDDNPDIADAARQQERDADSYGNHWMSEVNQNYSTQDAQRVLNRIKEYELRENIPPTRTYDSADVRAVLLNRGF